MNLHETLAAEWDKYNSLSGRSTSKRRERIMRQLSEIDLIGMLRKRGIRIVFDATVDAYRVQTGPIR